MPRYFAVKPTTDTPGRTFADADRIAADMYEAVSPLNVRLLAVRPRDSSGYVFAISSRTRMAADQVVARLRKQPQLASYQFSREAETLEGPFVWS
jgi:hypothetical protein